MTWLYSVGMPAVGDFGALLLAVLAVIGLAAGLAIAGVLKIELKRPTNRQR